jgi:tRNA(Ile)-lysidine synthase
MAGEEVREIVRAGGLLDGSRPVVVMLSGGRDSTCLIDVAVAILGAGLVSALHVNYRLREESGEDERHCAELCGSLGVELTVIPAPGEPAGRGGAPGNLQAWAREVRYAAAERLARERGGLYATGHTASDQVETILYRLAASPGRRALLGMVPAEGLMIRPLLELRREQTGAYCEARGLPWREDESNEDHSFARSRVRHLLVPALREIHPAAESNVLRTAALLREETELLDWIVQGELAGESTIAVERLARMPGALARLLVIRLAEQATGTYVPQAGERVAELLALGRRGGRAELHVGSGTGAVIEDGMLRMVRLPPREPRMTPPEG